MTKLILNVDDTPANLYARTRLLQRSGYEVLEARTGREALEKLADCGPGLMLLDVKLPDISGLEVCQQAKRNPSTREIPVVQISAVQVSDRDVAYGVQSGADFYVTEPVREESLLLVIDALLARRKLLDRIEKTSVKDLLRDARAPLEGTLATLGHELRDPLHTMSTWLSVLRDPGLPAADRRRALERLQRAVDVQSAIIGDLLELARISDGKLPVSLQPMPLERAIIEAIDDMHAAIVEKAIRVSLASSGAVWINGDAERLCQVVRNLLANAIRFTSVGGQVTIACVRRGAEAEVSVADDGEGVAADLLPRVFEAFRQVERTGMEPQAGVGFGLAIVAHIVREHGGWISVASAGRGKGATVTMRFPAISAPR